VACYGGLANRLRVLTSAVVMAEAAGRALTMHWHQMATCGARFDELFTNELPVIEFAGGPTTPLPHFAGPLGRNFIDVLTATEAHIAVMAVTWLALPEVFPNHAALLAKCAGALDDLQPRPEIAGRVTAFRGAHFRPRMIGVHLRRGDFHRAARYSVDNTNTALQATRRFLDADPEAGILLCTDDGAEDPHTGRRKVEGAREKFRGAFGERVVWTEPRSLNRGDAAAVQDALVDLLLLRVCDAGVGTWQSSFSEVAWFGRETPVVMCRSGGVWGVIDAAGQRLGVWRRMNGWARRVTGGRAGALQVMAHVRGWPRATAARLLRTHAPRLFERVRPKMKR
jgi:hypothetical protein